MIYEKRDKAKQYCTAVAATNFCGDCPLRNQEWDHSIPGVNCLNFAQATEAELDRALRIFEDYFKKLDGYNAVFMVDETEEVECDCETCKYYDEQYDDTVCSDCKHGIPHQSPRYETAPIKWTPATSDPVNDPVNRPSHYTQGGIECIDAIEASMSPLEYAGFLKGQVLKYVWRYRHKGKPVEDLKKAKFYLDRLIPVIEKEEVKT